jgi:hypothetical protein
MTQRRSQAVTSRAAVMIALIVLAILSAPAAASAQEPCPNEALRVEQGSTFLPDCRAYELVSPPDKNGGDVIAEAQRTRAAADGGAASFTSLAGFGDVKGTGVATEYLSTRSSEANPGTSGWSAHALTPPQAPLSLFAVAFSLEPVYQGEFSDDLARGVFRAWSPLTSDPEVKDVVNLYVRDDLRTPSAGSYQLVSGCPLCDATSTPLPPIASSASRPFLAGASADFAHVIFESRLDLATGAVGAAPKLYESDHGVVRLAGVRPDGTAPASSVAGQGASQILHTPHTISRDGSRIFFTDRTNTTTGKDGTLYLRTDGTTTVQLNASERTDCAGDPTCGGNGVPDPAPDPSGTQAATYWDASADGSRAFFTTQEALTDDAPLGGTKLYMYDANKPGTDAQNLTLLSVDAQPADPTDAQGVIGASDDGHYAYFVAAGQLVAGAPVLGTALGIYVWHDGTVDYVGELAKASDKLEDLDANWSLIQKQARVTPDGRHLLFSTTDGTGLKGYDQGSCIDTSVGTGCRELYVYDAQSKNLACASCNPSGAPATTSASDLVITGQGASNTTWHVNHPLSNDGTRVFFSTAEALVPEDVNGKSDAYEYDVSSGTVHLISSGTDSADSYFMDASANGNDVFFVTRERLVGWDLDDNYDLYDARVGGGFPEPPSPPPQCQAPDCQGAPPAAPAAAAPGSAAFSGVGNLTLAAPLAPRTRAITKAHGLKRALQACRHLPRRRRHRCEVRARRHYASRTVSKTARPR